MGALEPALSYALFDFGLARTGAADVTLARAALVLNLTPVAAAAAAVLVLGERLSWPEAGGGILVMLAAASAGAAVDGQPEEAAAVVCPAPSASR